MSLETLQTLDAAVQNTKRLRSKLAQLRKQIDTMMLDLTNIDMAIKAIQEGMTPPKPQPPSKPGKNPPSRLAVTMPNGTKIERDSAADTFADVIELLGLDQLMRRFPNIIDTLPHARQSAQRGRYFINTTNNTKAKSKILYQMASLLGIRLEIHLVDKI